MKINITGVSGSRVAYYAQGRLLRRKTMIIVSRAGCYDEAQGRYFVQDRDIFIMPEEDELQIAF